MLEEDFPKDKHLEFQGIKISGNQFHNIYIPPASSCEAGYVPNITPFLPNDDGYLLGDINAHDPLWSSSIQDARGALLAEVIGDSNLGVMNTESPTRLPTNGQPTSPDISLASLALLPYTTWETHTSLGSDHLPIVITCTTNIQAQPSEKRTYINFKKANWPEFLVKTELEFSKLTPPNSVYKGEKAFRKIVNNISKKCIPSGRIKETIPNIPTEAALKMKTRDQIRTTDPHSPQIAELNLEIETLIKDHKQEKWRTLVGNIERKTDSGKLFKLIKNLNGQSQSKNNSAIRFKGKYLLNPLKIADSFNNQFSSAVRHTSSK